MSDEQRVRVSVDERGVAEVALVRTKKMNTIDAAMFTATSWLRRVAAVSIVCQPAP